MLLEISDGPITRSPEQVPQSALSGKWKLGIAALAVTAALAGWYWHTTRLSETERKLLGAWEDVSRGPWIFRRDGTATVEWFPEQIPFRQSGGLHTDYSIDCDWSVEAGVLILREQYRPLSSAAPILTRAQHWLNHVRFPRVHRLPLVLRKDRALVLQKWTDHPYGENNLLLQRPGSTWPPPSPEVRAVMYSKPWEGPRRTGLLGQNDRSR